MGSVPVKVMLGVVPPDEAMLPDAVTEVTQVEQVRVSAVPPNETAPPPANGPLVLTVTLEFWSWALPMVDEAMTWPLGLTASKEEVRPVNARLVVVADVVVAVLMVSPPT